MQMGHDTKDNSSTATSKARVLFITSLFKMMISSNTSGTGKIQLLMARAGLSIKMGIASTATSKMATETAMVAISSVDTSDMRESGRTISFMDLENYTEIMIFSSRAGSKMA